MPRLEIITTMGAVIHVDTEVPNQMQMLEVATAAFGGEVFRAELETIDEASA